MAFWPIVKDSPEEIYISANNWLYIIEVVRVESDTASNCTIECHVLEEGFALLHRFKQILHGESKFGSMLGKRDADVSKRSTDLHSW